VHHFALETRGISGKVDDLLVAFFSAAVKMMQSKVEGVEDENKQLQKRQEGDNENSSKKCVIAMVAYNSVSNTSTTACKPIDLLDL
jgi:hypothetical protein